jgi:hypothetical protein
MNVKYGCIVVAVFVPLALSFTTGCTSDEKPAGEKSAAAPLQVAGTVALVGQHVDFAPQSSGNECVGKGAFSGLKEGTQVRITDGTGKALAVTRLGMGIADTSSDDLAAGFCVFRFDASVPSGQGSYTVEVTNYGDQTFSEKQMAAPQLAIG